MAKDLKDLRLYTIVYDLYDCTPNSRVGLRLDYGYCCVIRH